MRTKLVTLALAVSTLGMSFFVGCCCPEGRHSPTAGSEALLEPAAGMGELVSHARGTARFIGPKIGPNEARFHLRGSYEFKGPPGNVPKVVRVDLYSAPGIIADPQEAVNKGVKFDTVIPGSIVDDGIHWSYPAQHAVPWNISINKEGTLVARTTYNIVTTGGTYGPYTAHWLAHMKGIKESPFIKWEDTYITRDPPPAADDTGSTNSTAVCHGTFSGTQMMAYYDISVQYNVKQVKRIEVYAASAGVITATNPVTQSAYLIFSQRTGFAAPASTWVDNDVPGPYDGTSNEYVMVIRVIFTDNTLEDNGGRFHEISGQPGATILMN